MYKYPKINTLLNRDSETHKVIPGQWRLPEFEYLKDNEWFFTEKIDGTNVRVQWWSDEEGLVEPFLEFKARTDKGELPPFLLEKLKELFHKEQLNELFPNKCVCLYGEGIGCSRGKCIQKTGKLYSPDEPDFVLFDIQIGEWWLKREDIEGIAERLGIKVVPIIGEGKLEDAIELVRNSFNSRWGDFPAEGLVVRPKVDLYMRNGERVIGKIKTKDFA